MLVRHQVEHAVADDHVRPAILNWQSFGGALAELYVVSPDLRCRPTRLVEHRGGHVYADPLAGWTHHRRGYQAVDPRATTDINDVLAQLQWAEAERIARSGKRLDRRFRNACEPLRLVADNSSQRTA